MAMSRAIKKWGLVLASPVLLFLLVALTFQIWYCAARPKHGPVIGVSADSAWHARLGLTTASYKIALTRANGRVFMFREGEHTPEEILDRVDGLLLAGGGDVAPETYGGAGVAAELTSAARDQFEIALIRGALERDLPILGICRGIQILNVAHGGTLRTIRSEEETARYHGSKLRYGHRHQATVLADTYLASLIGAGEREVNSYHGQAIERVGAGLDTAAVAGDGIVEAVERADRFFVIAVQWHPELLSLAEREEMTLFSALVDAARTYATGKHNDINVASQALMATYEWRELPGKERKEFFNKVQQYLGGLHSLMRGTDVKKRGDAEQKYNTVKDNGLKALHLLSGEPQPFADPDVAFEWWKENKKRRWDDYVGPRFRKKEEAKKVEKPEGKAEEPAKDEKKS